ncbi:MAG TPA: proline/glycine betaine ABC transporter permease [Bacilli bacterium]|nr:proline/glycine betaine ABC transporter permease [Bacilli bacterium]
MNELIPKIPLAAWIDQFIHWLTNQFSGLFDWISKILIWMIEGLVTGLGFVPAFLFALILGLLAWWLTKPSIAIFTFVGFLFIDYLGYWTPMLDTLALVIVSVFITVIVGIPIGILASQSDSIRKVVIPLLDFMQTMPAFVYLLPAIFFFNIGFVPGVVASVIFAMPPTIRLTILGIQQVPKDLIEATDAFGSTNAQRLFKVQLPLAMPTMMAGINQTIMLSLSMVVIASMVGAPGLGVEIYRAVTQLKIGIGFEAGLAIVIVAIVLDRMTQNLGKKNGGTI